MNRSNSNWWESAFDDKYLKTYVDILTPERTEAQVDLLLKRIRPKRGAAILDLACGHGRHSLLLAKRGYRMTGIDYSRHFIDLAKCEAKEQKLDVEFVRGDMRSLPFQRRFDDVICMFTSFGYFVDEADHRRVLQQVAKVLKPGGRFLLDLNNPISLLLNLSEAGSVDSRGRLIHVKQDQLSNGLDVKTTDMFDPTNMRWSMAREWKESGKKRSYSTSLRVFSVPELTSLLAECGLHVERVWGDLKGSTYGCESRRMVLLATKK